MTTNSGFVLVMLSVMEDELSNVVDGVLAGFCEIRGFDLEWWKKYIFGVFGGIIGSDT